MLNFIRKASSNTQKANIDRSIQRICYVVDEAEKDGLSGEKINQILERLESIQSDFIGPMGQREIRMACFDPVLATDGSVLKKELLLYSLYSGTLKREFSLEDLNSLDSRNSQASIESVPTAFLSGLLLDCFKSVLQLNGFNSFRKINNETVQIAYIAAKKTYELNPQSGVFSPLGIINFVALKYLTVLESRGYDYLETKIKEDYHNYQKTRIIPKEYTVKELMLKPYTFYNFDSSVYFLKYGIRVID